MIQARSNEELTVREKMNLKFLISHALLLQHVISIITMTCVDENYCFL